MKKTCIALLFLIALGLYAQSTTGLLLPIWTGRQYQYFRLGPSLSVVNGQVDVMLPPPQRQRFYDKQLDFDTTKKGYVLPAGASDAVVYVNGLRYHAGLDYTITSGVVVPACVPGADGCNWDSSFVVTVDFSQ